MIDLHCHILPAIDDGADSLDKSLAMARIAVADGITHTACTPHIYPAVFENDAAGIGQAIAALRHALNAEGIALQLSIGADVHLVPEVAQGLKTGRIPTLSGSRYFLLEPAHHVRPAYFTDSVFNLQSAGYVPLITHPERLSWCEEYYQDFVELACGGVWMQLTAGSLTGRFGPQVQRTAERMLDDGIVHLLATDAHSTDARPPLLAEGRAVAASRLGEEEAERLVLHRPRAILKNLPPSALPPPPGLAPGAPRPAGGGRRPWWQRLLG